MKRIDSLEGLRGVAVLMVLFSHLCEQMLFCSYPVQGFWLHRQNIRTYGYALLHVVSAHPVGGDSRTGNT